MSTWRPNDVDSDNSDEEESAFDIKGREAYIFVLDSLLIEDIDKCDMSLKLLEDALISGLMVKDKDLIGLVFANTLHSPLPEDAEGVKNIVKQDNCAVFLPLRQLSKEIVDYFFQFKENDVARFSTNYGTSQGSFINMLRLCGNMFQQCGQELSNRTIVYITDCEAPVNAEELQKVLQKASDMEGQNIDFTVVPMVDEFSYEPFYKEFLSLVKGIDIESLEIPDPQMIREIVADRKLRLNVNKRCLGHVNWNLGNDLELSVKFYNYFQKSSYPQRVHLRRSDNSVVTAKVANYIDEKDPDTGKFVRHREVRTDEMVYELSCGNERVSVEENEMVKICYPYQPTLQLMGFKDRSAVLRENFVRPCSFIYPDESRISGSTRLFTALWMRCHEKNKVAVCIFIPRKKAKPTFVALVPVSTSDANKRTLMDGDGFKVFYLPLAEDLHRFDLKKWDVDRCPEPKGRELFKKIIKKLRVKYIPSKTNDPALEEIQAKLLALAFNYKCENNNNKIPPCTTKMDDRIEHLSGEIEEVFGTETTVVEKRKSTTSLTTGSPAKVMKTADSSLTIPMIDDLIARDGLDSLNKGQLLSFLTENGIKVPRSTSKSILIEKVIDFRGQN